jgi:hypothetical protein
MRIGEHHEVIGKHSGFCKPPLTYERPAIGGVISKITLISK